MIARISEPEAVDRAGEVVTWKVVLSASPPIGWRRRFLDRAASIFGAVGSSVWIADAELLFELEATALRIGLEEIDAWIADANMAEYTLDVAPRPETVLVVGGAADVRAVACEILEEQGYAVLDTADPCEALGVAARHHIDLVLADVALRGMSGQDLAVGLRSVSPGTRILFICANAHYAELGNMTPFIANRYTVQGLVDNVRDVLRNRTACGWTDRVAPPRQG
ncbi:MAG TPA: response regulator [Methylomirabilota bacterium]|jgi:CheY-like chemotaxis protein|nr:response regulator [Methylomirabilota bacterium]